MKAREKNVRRWLAVFAAPLVAFPLVWACSSDAPESFPSDSGVDGGADVVRETAVESGFDGSASCARIKGDCDIVAQDCADEPPGARRECVVVGAGAEAGTRCLPVQASQRLEIGAACCPVVGDGGSSCLPGLTCVGRACVDGGEPSGRCSPACCEGDDRVCGKSAPEGIGGACDLVLVDPTTDEPLHGVCSYRERCRPFGIEPCRAGQACMVEDEIGTASCLTSFDTPRGAVCTFANDCADGLVCIARGDAGACRTVCLIPGSTHPFDASVENAGPGAGGCEPGTVCRGPLADMPNWYGFCTDGG